MNQVIAIEKGIKSKGNTEKSEFYKIAQKPALFSGFVKRYRPLNEQGEKFPDEKSKVQYTAQGLLTSIGRPSARSLMSRRRRITPTASRERTWWSMAAYLLRGRRQPSFSISTRS